MIISSLVSTNPFRSADFSTSTSLIFSPSMSSLVFYLSAGFGHSSFIFDFVSSLSADIIIPVI